MVPLGNVIQLQIGYCNNVGIEAWQYEGRKRIYPDMLSTLNCPDDDRKIYSWTNSIVLIFTQRTGLICATSFFFTAINASDTDRLHVTFLSPVAGYIHAPRNINQYFKSCVTITPPADQKIFFSHTKTDKDFELPILLRGPCGQKNDKGKQLNQIAVTLPDWFESPVDVSDWFSLVFGSPEARQEEWNTTSVSVLYEEVMARDPTGFHFMFSFQRSKPQQVGDQWNCSRSEWPELYRHFHCDMSPLCVDQEDETQCPYYSEDCGTGKIAAEGGCFIFVETQRPSNTTMFKSECAKRDALPATFDSIQQWESVFSTIYVNLGHDFHVLIDMCPGIQTWRQSKDIYLKNMYINTLQWGGGPVAYNLHHSFFTTDHQVTMKILAENRAEPKSALLCRVHDTKPSERIIFDTKVNVTESPVPIVTCPSQHVTHVQLACDVDSLCAEKVKSSERSQTVMCKADAAHVTPYFRCMMTGEYVSYSLVCNWRQDCSDNSDESFCQFPICAENNYNCGHGQCIHSTQVCDNLSNCMREEDEIFCLANKMVKPDTFDLYPPALINLDKPGSFSLVSLPGNTSQCPDTHYQCPGNGYCLPVYTRCNGMIDCPAHDDEAWCDEFTCEGLYRCRGKDRQICLHVDHLCDGWPHCPQHDDELMCGLTDSCPDQCVCYGASFTELFVFQPDTVPKIRYLEGRGSGLTLDAITGQTMLIHLGAGACGWRYLNNVSLPNLHVLDISDNLIQYIEFDNFSQLFNLKELHLSGNTLISGISAHSVRLESLVLLNLSLASDTSYILHTFSDIMPQVEIINFSHSGLKSLQGRGLFSNLKILDLQGCPVPDIGRDFLKGMDKLQQLFADNFKFCCPDALPDSFDGICNAPEDELSSCDNLLKSGSYRVAVAIFIMTALFGNLCSIVYRSLSLSKSKVGYAVFVIHLSVSDFFMGVYLMIIAVADRVYYGTYLWNESYWKESTTCKISGFLSLLSCEVSSFLICLITLDRFLVMRFPFSHLRFGTTSAHVACAISWGLGMILASIPLLPATSHWEFYHQTGMCMPLPITRRYFPGSFYSFCIMIVLNMIIFICIATGQALIYWSVRANTIPGHGSKNKDNSVIRDKSRSKDVIIARRLLIIAMSDFLCWFPIGVCGLLAKLDVPVPGEINIALTIFVLPFNSAVNPFLYTFTVIQEKRRKERERILQKIIAERVKESNRFMNR